MRIAAYASHYAYADYGRARAAIECFLSLRADALKLLLYADADAAPLLQRPWRERLRAVAAVHAMPQ